jgi:hypothetical protein
MTHNTVFSTIKAQDAAALEALLCQNIKDHTPDMAERIETIFQLVSGTSGHKMTAGGAEYDGSRGGKSISQKTCDLRYTKDGVSYRLFICWEVNNFSPAEAGMRQFAVSMWHGTGEGWKSIVALKATEGVRDWHD